MSQLWKDVCRRRKADTRMDQSAPEIRNGRDAATATLPVRRKSQPQDREHDHHENQKHNNYAVQPPKEDDRILHQYHTADTDASSEAASEERAIRDHYVPQNLGFSSEAEIESVGPTSVLNIEHPLRKLRDDTRGQIREYHTVEAVYRNIVWLRPEVYETSPQDLHSLWTFIRTNFPHPLEHYSARKSLIPPGALDQSPSSTFIYTNCRQQGLLQLGTIKTPIGRLTLRPRGKTWADKYTKEFKNSLKKFKTPRAKCHRSGGTINIIWSRWVALHMARSYAMWFSKSPWWQGAIGAATFEGGQPTSDWVHLLDALFTYSDNDPPVDAAQAHELYSALTKVLEEESRVDSNSKLFEVPIRTSQRYKVVTALTGYQGPTGRMSPGAFALSLTKVLMFLENKFTATFGTLAEGKIWFDIQKFRGGYIDRNGNRRNRDGSSITFGQNERRHKKRKVAGKQQRSRQARHTLEASSIRSEKQNFRQARHDTQDPNNPSNQELLQLLEHSPLSSDIPSKRVISPLLEKLVQGSDNSTPDNENRQVEQALEESSIPIPEDESHEELNIPCIKESWFTIPEQGSSEPDSLSGCDTTPAEVLAILHQYIALTNPQH